ncbi:gamma-glutamylcyclotransferase family protein [Dehalogenimonas sp. THU2]|uniref:gamma-glutamylcyclotransferase family protein n=1 Tax=Dehalogenimonas sp. THU2 TaxID=3151121 RepID=UPI003218B28F
MTLVFQYGSNTSLSRINSDDRLRGDARPIGIAYTEDDYDLEFTVCSKGNKCAAASIEQGSGRNIWGVLYDIPDYLIYRGQSGERKSLDKIEGEGVNYRRMPIRVRDSEGKSIIEPVITYVALDRKQGIKTSSVYANLIIAGLKENNVPNDYIEYVRTKILENNADLGNELN